MQAVDIFDDLGEALLFSLRESGEEIPEFLKSASWQESSDLHDRDFALILVDEEGHEHRKFACFDGGNTAVSVWYLLNAEHGLSAPAVKVAAANLVRAGTGQGIDIDQVLMDLADIDVVELESRIMDERRVQYLEKEAGIADVMRFGAAAAKGLGKGVQAVVAAPGALYEGARGAIAAGGAKGVGAAKALKTEIGTGWRAGMSGRTVTNQAAVEARAARMKASAPGKPAALPPPTPPPVPPPTASSAGAATETAQQAGSAATTTAKVTPSIAAKPGWSGKQVAAGAAGGLATGAALAGGGYLLNKHLQNQQPKMASFLKQASVTVRIDEKGNKKTDKEDKKPAEKKPAAKKTPKQQPMAVDPAAMQQAMAPPPPPPAEKVTPTVGQIASGVVAPDPAAAQMQDPNAQPAPAQVAPGQPMPVTAPVAPVAPAQPAALTPQKTASVFNLIKEAELAWHELDPYDRHILATALCKDASACDARVPDHIWVYGGEELNPQFSRLMAMRLDYTSDPSLQHEYNRLPKVASTLGLETLVNVLYSLDDHANLCQKYGSKLPDPLLCVYGREKVASWKWNHGGHFVNEDQLWQFSTSAASKTRMNQLFNEALVDKFRASPVETFKGMPLHQQSIIANMVAQYAEIS